MPTEAIVGHAVTTATIHLLDRIRRIRFWKCKLLHPNAEIRVSFPAMLRISDGGRYVLVRNLHRPEVFGPFGGVYKFYNAAKSELDALLFRPQDVGLNRDMKDDLRGFLPRKNLSKINKWFLEHRDRESATECLNRELEEEIKEIGLDGKIQMPKHFEIRKVRSVEDKPSKVPGQTYTQYRLFEIYEPVPTSQEAFNFIAELVKLAAHHNDLMLVDSDDIIAGRSNDSRLIGSHVAYLIGKKRIIPDVPPFVSSHK